MDPPTTEPAASASANQSAATPAPAVTGTAVAGQSEARKALRIQVDDASMQQAHIAHMSPLSDASTPSGLKRRRTVPAKLIEDNVTPPPGSKSPFVGKRPRGRPPLSTRGRASPRFPSRGGPGRGRPPLRSPSAASGSPAAASTDDRPRGASIEHATQLVLSRLMTEDPLPLSELSKTAPDLSKDQLTSVLEVLQVLGLVMQVRPREPTTGGPEKLYTLAGFVRAPEAVDVAALDRVLQEKRDSVETVQLRVAALKDLMDKPGSKQERKADLRQLLEDMISASPKLQYDLLYRNLLEASGADIKNSR